ncbi:MAG: Type pili twitching motility protein PilT [Acidimicrobiales bacterium]|nr:Type pili twitching motility protein PilT [Acidimicrobiales bacterium]
MHRTRRPPGVDAVLPEVDAHVALLVDLLQHLMEERGSDLLVKVGSAPCIRRDGKLVRTTLPALSPVEIEALAMELLHDAKAAEFAETGEVDVAHSVPGLGRFRVNVYRQRGSASLAIRRVVPGAPAITDLGVPAVVADLASAPDGLVVVAGPAASGKTTTVSAMLDHVNSTVAKHIVTIEDPIEVLHADRQSIVSQREVGTDTPDVAEAIRRAGRQDADVIFVSDLPDHRAIHAAISTAGAGRLVLAVLPATTVIEAIARLVDAYPVHQHDQVRQHLSVVLRGVVCQRLLYRADGRGRVPAVESLVGTAKVADCIAAGADPVRLEKLMTEGEYYGMQTFDQALFHLFREDYVALDEALAAAARPENLRIAVQQAGLAPLR